MKLNLRWNWEVHDKSGLLIARHPLWDQGGELGHSFVRQMLQILFVQMEQTTGPATTKDTGDTSRAVTVNADHLNLESNAALSGIVVGTGSAGVLMDDEALGTLIADGVGATQLNYGDTTFESVTQGPTTAEFIITRSFLNTAGGGDITINEVGLYAKATGNPWYFMIARDKLSSPITATDGATTNVKATLQIDL